MEGRPLSKIGANRRRWAGLLVAVFHACLSLASPATQVLAHGIPEGVRAAIGGAIVAGTLLAVAYW